MARRNQAPNGLEQARADVEASDLKPVYLLRAGRGQEAFLGRRAYDLLYEAGVGGGPRGFNEQVFAAEKTDGDAIAAAANTLPMMGPRRVVVVRSVNRLKTADQDRLAAYCSAPSATTVLLLVEDPMTSTAAKRPSPLDGRRKLVKAIKKTGRDLQFKRLYGRALAGWMAAETRALGKTFDDRGSDFLEAMVGNDLGQVHNALTLAALYVGDEPHIALNDLEQVVSGRNQEALWSFLDAVGRRDRQDALWHLQKMYGQGEEVPPVLNLLNKRIRLLLTAELGQRRGLGVDAALQAAGVAPNMVWKHRDQVGNYRAIELRRAVSRLLEAESDFKGGRRVDGRWALERAVIDILN
ncbi:MAG TPA: DNA polymerase III subunit delta [Deltaproteobacteria bacterium]|nr:DNA polymerase III subunit delta [Deltaproteobacteria bacterium]HCP45650.1 DNA polymerase III subunit delta [Deltaproteobacteria bacterium]